MVAAPTPGNGPASRLSSASNRSAASSSPQSTSVAVNVPPVTTRAVARAEPRALDRALERGARAREVAAEAPDAREPELGDAECHLGTVLARPGRNALEPALCVRIAVRGQQHQCDEGEHQRVRRLVAQHPAGRERALRYLGGGRCTLRAGARADQRQRAEQQALGGGAAGQIRGLTLDPRGRVDHQRVEEHPEPELGGQQHAPVAGVGRERIELALQHAPRPPHRGRSWRARWRDRG